MRTKTKALITTALAGALIAGSVYAQETTPPAAADAGSDDVVVVGVRKSLQKSLTTKRRASAHIDVITAEDVSKFPDVNVAESLSRLPGITVDRTGGGEGEHIAINGINSRLINVSLNGTPIASTQSGVNDKDTGRSFNLGNLAPELIGDVQVFKTTEARLDEGGIGGSVIVNSRKPLSMPANTLSVNLNYNQNQRNKESDPRYSIFYSTKDDSGRFGFLANYAYNKSVLGSGNVNIDYRSVCNGYNWAGCTNGAFNAPTPATPTSAAKFNPTVSDGPALTTSMLVPTSIYSNVGSSTRERQTLQIAFQYRPTEDLEFNLSGTSIQSDYSSYNQQMQVDISTNDRQFKPYDAFDSSGNLAVQRTKMTSVQTNEAGVIGGTGPAAVGLKLFRNISNLVTNTINLESRWTPGDWDFKVNLGESKATGGVSPQYYMDLAGNTTVQWSASQDGIDLTLGKAATDPTLWKTGALNSQSGYVKTAETLDHYKYLFFDGKREVSWGPVTEVLFGFKAQEHISQNTPHFYNTIYKTVGNMSAYSTFTTSPDLFDGLGVTGDLTSFAAFTPESIAALAEASKSPGNANGDYRDAGQLWDTTEKTTAAYLQANFRHGKWHGDVGVRYAKTENAQTYRSTMDYYPWSEEMISIDRSYDDFLPSFNAAYDLTDEMMIRFSAGKVMSRPTFADMSGQVEYSLDRFCADAPDHFCGGGGNPNLQPYRATNYSASYEWYFAPNSLFNVDLTFKDVESYIVKKNTFVDVTLPQNALGYCQGTVGRACNRVENMLVYAPFNGSNAKIPGVSVGWQGNLWYGFGLQANATWLDQSYGSYTDQYNKTSGKLPMPYLSKWSYTVSPYYEHGPIQARVSYTFRTKYTTEIGSETTSPRYVDGWGQLDASASYDVNKQLSFNVAAQNILDDMQHPYTNGGLPLGWNKYGTRVTFGVTYRIR
jgi:iron complex outermembrane recepter protein